MKKASGSQFASPTDPLAARIRQRKQPVQGRSRSTVQAILEATFQVLLAGGWARLTTTRVAERAGVSVGTLYQYFPDKRSLVVALQLQYLELVVNRIAEAARAIVGQPLEPAVRSLVSSVIALKREHLELILALREPMLEAGGEGLLREGTRRVVREVQLVLEGARADLADPAAAARTLSAALEGVIDRLLQESPAALRRPEVQDDLVALAVGYLRELGRARGADPALRR